MKINSEFKGLKGQLAVQQRANEKGYIVSIPTMTACRYDLILERNGKILKAQCKYVGFQKNDGVARVGLRKHGRNYQRHEIDILLIFLEPIQKIVALYDKHFHNKKEILLRYKAAQATNGQQCLNVYNFIW